MVLLEQFSAVPHLAQWLSSYRVVTTELGHCIFDSCICFFSSSQVRKENQLHYFLAYTDRPQSKQRNHLAAAACRYSASPIQFIQARCDYTSTPSDSGRCFSQRRCSLCSARQVGTSFRTTQSALRKLPLEIDQQSATLRLQPSGPACVTDVRLLRTPHSFTSHAGCQRQATCVN